MTLLLTIYLGSDHCLWFPSDFAGVGLFLRVLEARTPSQLWTLSEEEGWLWGYPGSEIKWTMNAASIPGGERPPAEGGPCLTYFESCVRMIKDIKHKLSGWSIPAYVDGSPGCPVQDVHWWWWPELANNLTSLLYSEVFLFFKPFCKRSQFVDFFSNFFGLKATAD